MNAQTIRKAAQNKGVRIGLLVAILGGATKFDDGFNLLYSKWTADVVAGEAKGIATGVKSELDLYLQEEREARKAEKAYYQGQKDLIDKQIKLEEKKQIFQQQYEQNYRNQAAPPVRVAPPNQPVFAAPVRRSHAPRDTTEETYWCEEDQGYFPESHFTEGK